MPVMAFAWAVLAAVVAVAIWQYAPDTAMVVLRFWRIAFTAFGLLVAFYLLTSGGTATVVAGMILFIVGIWKLLDNGYFDGVMA